MSVAIDECILEAMDELDSIHSDEDGELIDQVAGETDITIDMENLEDGDIIDMVDDFDD